MIPRNRRRIKPIVTIRAAWFSVLRPLDDGLRCPPPPAPMPLSEADYEAIEEAVVETYRGRWFLAEYAKRHRHADTKMLLSAIERLAAAIHGERAAQSATRIRFDLLDMVKAIADTKAEIAAIDPDATHHGK